MLTYALKIRELLKKFADMWILDYESDVDFTIRMEKEYNERHFNKKSS